jgi:hypothetical protein
MSRRFSRGRVRIFQNILEGHDHLMYYDFARTQDIMRIFCGDTSGCHRISSRVLSRPCKKTIITSKEKNYNHGA